MKHLFASLVLALFLAACSQGRTPGTDGGPRPDAPVPPGVDGGPVTGDPCLAGTGTAALATLGCNGGFASGTPAANAPAGTCTGGGDTMPAGTCTGAAICSAAAGAAGWCFPTCTPGVMYVSRGGCPTGFRCFDLTDGDFCFRDCDTSHPCPTGMACDGEGSCGPPAAP